MKADICVTDRDCLSTNIDRLASDLVLGDGFEDPSAWEASLRALAEMASSSGYEHVAQVARNAATLAGTAAAEGETQLVFVVEGAIEQMRNMLESYSSNDASPVAAAEPASSLGQDPELLADFVVESREHLENIEAQVLQLEQNGQNTEALHSIFRSYHTVKGLAGFLELPSIQAVAHEVETVLDKARHGELAISAAAIDVILESKDYLGRWLQHLDGGPAKTHPPVLMNNKALLQRVAALHQATAAAPTEVPAVRREEAQVHVPDQEQTREVDKSRSVKVHTEKLDYLVDMVGEMVIAQSLVRHDPDMAQVKNERLTRNLAQLARITDEVQRTAMSMRMVPIGPLFQRMARLVRDLGRRFGKHVQFESQGEGVELDRNIVEELADPLMHMVRNSLDHGIEPESDRVQAGKPALAKVELRAFHQSGQIVIQVIDDGRGINREKVLAKAVAKGIVSANSHLTDSECFNLIFHPGFSTAEQVTEVSGRGVGMDVVKRQIQKLRGSVEIESVPGVGTTFSLRLPLTLAIIDGLVVVVGSERYIIPLSSVKEIFRPTAESVTTVENRAEVVSVRDKLLPVLRLHERFTVTPRSTRPEEAVFVVAEVEGACFCLLVDDLIGKQEVVIKSLGPVFQQVSGVAGGAILGDGQIGLILDVKSLFGGRSNV